MNRKLLFNQNNHHNKKGLYNQLFSGICTEAQKKEYIEFNCFTIGNSSLLWNNILRKSIYSLYHVCMYLIF